MNSQEYKNMVLGKSFLEDYGAAPLKMGIDVGSPEGDRSVIKMLLMSEGAQVGRQSFIDACNYEGKENPVSWTEAGERMHEDIERAFRYPQLPELFQIKPMGVGRDLVAELKEAFKHKNARKSSLSPAKQSGRSAMFAELRDMIGQNKVRIPGKERTKLNDELGKYIDMKLKAGENE